MKRVDPKCPPKPCDYFDLIGGTSTGGYVLQFSQRECDTQPVAWKFWILTLNRIIALMLGRLRMGVDECIEKYIALSSASFSPKRSKAGVFLKLKDKWEVNGAYRADVLEKETRQVAQEHEEGKSPDAKLLDLRPGCRV